MSGVELKLCDIVAVAFDILDYRLVDTSRIPTNFRTWPIFEEREQLTRSIPLLDDLSTPSQQRARMDMNMLVTIWVHFALARH